MIGVLSPSGIVYRIPVYNFSTSENLSVTCQSVVNGSSQVWLTESSVLSECQNIRPDAKCIVEAAFDVAKLQSMSQLSSILTISFANGTIGSLPLAAYLNLNG